MITGGIAVYKACFLARLLQQAGLSVKVAMTEAAQQFVNPMTFKVLTGHPVATDLWGDGQSEALDHIEYARWADLVVVAPATANTLAKAANGIADNIVSTLLLAHPGPVLWAPAMNDNMWRHPATQANLDLLRKRGAAVVGPGEGWLACGTVSAGRMSEPEEILAAVLKMVSGLPASGDVESPPAPSAVGGTPTDFWTGRRVVITAGPTHEAIDPVRYVANRSSGAMGYALAAAAVEAGAQVTLISGPSALMPPRGLTGLVETVSGRDMADAVAAALAEGADWLLMAAAVADFVPATSEESKLKKEQLGDRWQLELVRNPDILAEIVPMHRTVDLKVVGFALETDSLLERAAAKMRAKNLDYIVANDPTAPGAGFGPGDHRVTLLGRGGELWSSDSRPKPELAREILGRLADETLSGGQV